MDSRPGRAPRPSQVAHPGPRRQVHGEQKPLFPIKPIGGSLSPGDPMALLHVFGDEFKEQSGSLIFGAGQHSCLGLGLPRRSKTTLAREARRVITPTPAVDDSCQKRDG